MALFAPQAEDLLYRSVGKAEKHTISRGTYLEDLPGWNDEHIVLFNTPGVLADQHLSFP